MRRYGSYGRYRHYGYYGRCGHYGHYRHTACQWTEGTSYLIPIQMLALLLIYWMGRYGHTGSSHQIILNCDVVLPFSVARGQVILSVKQGQETLASAPMHEPKKSVIPQPVATPSTSTQQKETPREPSSER